MIVWLAGIRQLGLNPFRKKLPVASAVAGMRTEVFGGAPARAVHEMRQAGMRSFVVEPAAITRRFCDGS